MLSENLIILRWPKGQSYHVLVFLGHDSFDHHWFHPTHSLNFSTHGRQKEVFLSYLSQQKIRLDTLIKLYSQKYGLAYH